ncbi:MAG TPA: pilus assembly protein TadB, partial [Psychromonas sp.]
MTNEIWFLILIFATVIFLFQTLFVSVYSPQKTNTRLLRKHLKKITVDGRVQQADLVLNQKLEKLPGLFRSLEEIEFVKNLTYKLQLAGYKMF